MRKNAYFLIFLVMVLFGMFFTASCGKKVVQTEPMAATQTTQTTQPTLLDGSKASDRSAEQNEASTRPQQDRLRAEAPARETAETAFVNESVHFAFDSFILSGQARQILHAKAEYLRTNPGVTVLVEGHCDERGPDAYNLALGERRAESVKTFLVNLGIGAERLNTISYGEERPIAMGQDETSWAKNRRAQFVIN
jgi:peptidoglycan-associated lipoprotein